MEQVSESDDDLLTTQDVATMNKVTDRTVRNWARRGILPARRLPSGARRYRRADAVAILRPEFPSQ